MFPTEIVCEVNNNPCDSLQMHFNLFYKILSDYQPDSELHAVIGCPDKNWDERIEGELDQFANLIWYVDEAACSEFKVKLKEHGFHDSGIFQGLAGELKGNCAIPKIPGCELERVVDEKTMDAFIELASSTLAIPEREREAYKKALWLAAQGKNPLLYHWVARKEGKVVSALTTLVQGGIVSFWNGSTLPEYRCHGINTALRLLAINDAVEKGCHTGLSFLMGDGMAFGICKKLGFETKCRFQAFQSPKKGKLPLI